MTSAVEPLPVGALRDDPQWCGHAMVDLSTWRCADCDRPVAPAVRRWMEAAPSRAPRGSVWVLTERPQYQEDAAAGGYVVGVFTDRARIPRLLVRATIETAAGVRERIRSTTWYMSVYNPSCIEGWGEEDGEQVSYRLTVERVDDPG
jgi:hypothetical protein